MSSDKENTPAQPNDNAAEENTPQRDSRVRMNVRVPSRLMKLIKAEAIHKDRSVSSMVIEALWEKYRDQE